LTTFGKINPPSTGEVDVGDLIKLGINRYAYSEDVFVAIQAFDINQEAMSLGVNQRRYRGPEYIQREKLINHLLLKGYIVARQTN